MNRELSKEEIDKLFVFVRSKYVRWVDLQYELVDHLASGIEENMNADEKLSLDEALQAAYAGFPITGFSNFVAEKKKALARFWAKKYFVFMISYFKLPKIILLAGLIYIINTIFQTQESSGLILIYSVLVIATISSIIYRYKNQALLKELNGKYLVTSTFMGLSGMMTSTVIMIPFYTLDYFVSNNNFGPNQTILLACFASVVLLWIHAEIFAFPEMLKNELNTKYKHLNISYA